MSLRPAVRSRWPLPVLILIVLGGLPGAAPTQSPDPGAVERFIQFYYTDPRPETAAAEFRRFLLEDRSPVPLPVGRRTQGYVAYFFGRIAQGRPDLIREYEVLFPAVAPERRPAVVMALAVAGDPASRERLAEWREDPAYAASAALLGRTLAGFETVAPGPLDREVAVVSDLDFLWAEFYATGDGKVARRLLAVLDRPDHFRRQLDRWRTTHGDHAARRRLAGDLAAVGIRYEPVSNRLVTTGDLDLHCVRQLQTPGPGGPAPPLAALQRKLRLSGADLQQMAIKGVAFWSLHHHARAHPRLVELLTEALPSRRGGSRLAALWCLGAALVEAGQPARAIVYLNRLVEEAPHDLDAQTLRGEAFLAMGAITAARRVADQLLDPAPERARALARAIAERVRERLTVDDQTVWQPAGPAARSRLDQAVAAGRALTGYRSRAVLQSDAGARSPAGRTEWRFTHVRPDRYQVERRADGAAAGEAVQWRTIGRRHALIGPQAGEGRAGRKAVRTVGCGRDTAFLGMEKFLELMEREEPVELALVPAPLGELWVYRFRPDRWPPFDDRWNLREARYEALLWVDRASDRLEKAVVTVAGTDRAGRPLTGRFEQWFLDQDAPDLSIEAPTQEP